MVTNAYFLADRLSFNIGSTGMLYCFNSYYDVDGAYLNRVRGFCVKRDASHAYYVDFLGNSLKNCTPGMSLLIAENWYSGFLLVNCKLLAFVYLLVFLVSVFAGSPKTWQ